MYPLLFIAKRTRLTRFRTLFIMLVIILPHYHYLLIAKMFFIFSPPVDVCERYCLRLRCSAHHIVHMQTLLETSSAVILLLSDYSNHHFIFFSPCFLKTQACIGAQSVRQHSVYNVYAFDNYAQWDSLKTG